MSAKERLIDAAGHVFAAQGYEQATIREICERAGANLASVNYYFRDKETLYVETVRRARQLRVESHPMPTWSDETAASEKLTDFVTTLLRRMLRTDQAPWQARLLMREVLDPTSACHELVRDHFRPTFEQLMEILDDLLPAETPAPLRRQVGYSIIGQCLFYRVAGKVVEMIEPPQMRDEHFRVEQLAAHISYFSLAALGFQPPLTANADPLAASILDDSAAD